MKVSENIRYVGVTDRDIDRFEGQYPVPEGVSYNSYVILDEKIAVMDTVDKRASEEWFVNLSAALEGRAPDYLVANHLEPDHGANIAALAQKYPEMKIVASARAVAMLPQFFDMDFTGRCIAVKEGDTLPLGSHTLHFVMAPMVHWPEVMVSYEDSEKVLYSADAFGRFGDPESQGDWFPEARRYYLNIVGKYGPQVQALLKKAAALDIRTVCPLHGPVLTGDLGPILEKYDAWSSYRPESDGVLVAYASIHGNTAQAARQLAEMLKAKGAEVTLMDLVRTDSSAVLAEAFRCSRMVVASSSYDAGLFPAMDAFLRKLQAKSYQRRKVGIVENGSWAPSAGRCMKALLEEMKEIDLVPQMVTIKTTVKPETAAALETLAQAILA